MNKPSVKLAMAYATIAKMEDRIKELERAQPALGSDEVERLKEESFEGLYNAAIDERDQIKAHCDEAIRMLRGVHTGDLFGPEDWETVNYFLSKPAGSGQS